MDQQKIYYAMTSTLLKLYLKRNFTIIYKQVVPKFGDEKPATLFQLTGR